jgi:Arc/MetJ-type ribon-helix-helix transcriptional regulator
MLMSETITEVNIGEFLANKIDRVIQSRSIRGREDFVKKAVRYYLEELSIRNLKSDLFKETSNTKEIMLNAWKSPMGADDALKVLSSIGAGKTKETIDKSIQTTEDDVETKYVEAYKELQEIA